jgi:hypothetical protein
VKQRKSPPRPERRTLMRERERGEEGGHIRGNYHQQDHLHRMWRADQLPLLARSVEPVVTGTFGSPPALNLEYASRSASSSPLLPSCTFQVLLSWSVPFGTGSRSTTHTMSPPLSPPLPLFTEWAWLDVLRYGSMTRGSHATT